MNLAASLSRAVPTLTLALAVFALAACQQQKPAEEPAGQATTPEAKPGITVAGGALVLPVVKDRPGAAYFSVANGSDAATTLAAVTIDGAGKAEMHETQGGSMAPLAQIELKPGETVRFERGGKHVMVFDLAQTVKSGGTVEMTLTFAGGDKVSTPLKVEAVGGDTDGAMAGMDHGDHN